MPFTVKKPPAKMALQRTQRLPASVRIPKMDAIAPAQLPDSASVGQHERAAPADSATPLGHPASRGSRARERRQATPADARFLLESLATADPCVRELAIRLLAGLVCRPSNHLVEPGVQCWTSYGRFT